MVEQRALRARRDPSGRDPGIQPPTRRHLLTWAAGTALSGALLPALAACSAPAPLGKIEVAGGELGGFYLEFVGLLAAALQKYGVTKAAVALSTGGSADNFQRLLSGEATMGAVLADTAAQLMGANPGRVVALGKVYENYLHCIVRRDGGIRTLADLAGRPVGTGAVGSGTTLTARRILSAAGLGPSSSRPIVERQLGLNDGLAALRDGSIDALLWSGGLPTAAITAANGNFGLRFLELSPVLPTLRSNYGEYYERVLIPANSYAGTPAVGTAGVANLLLCRADLDAETAKRTVRLLVNHARDLIPKSSQGIQFLSRETLISTGGLPLHPAAAEAYREMHG